MDPAEALVTIVVIAGAVLAVWSVTWGVVQYARIQKQPAGSDPRLAEEIARLHSQVEVLQEQIGETQERLDFAERLLTRGPDGGTQS